MNNLMSPSDRLTASAAKQKTIISRLVSEVWTTTAIIALWLRQTHSSAHKTLKKMERDGLLKSAKVDGSKGKLVQVWGLSAGGVAAAFDDEKNVRDVPRMKPSKINALTMDHRIDIQFNHLIFEDAGFTNWVSDYQFKSILKGKKNWPDAICVNPQGQKVAIEIERTVKSLRRYHSILIAHLKARKAEEYLTIYYLMPSDALMKRVKKAFHSIESVKLDSGVVVQITAEHLKFFKFGVYIR